MDDTTTPTWCPHCEHGPPTEDARAVACYQVRVEQVERGRYTPREQAREMLEGHLASQRRLLADIERERDLPAFARKAFTTIDPNWLIAYYVRCLRWIDCAPDGANHLVAPMQGAYGVPMGGGDSYLVGPGEGMRDAIERRTGRPWIEAKLAQHEARQLRECNETDRCSGHVGTCQHGEVTA